MLHPPQSGKGMGCVVSLNQSANSLPHLLLGGVSLGTVYVGNDVGLM